MNSIPGQSLLVYLHRAIPPKPWLRIFLDPYINVGALMIRIELGVYYIIIIVRNPLQVITVSKLL